MNHWVIAPVLLPLFLGCLLVAPMTLAWRRAILVLGLMALIPVSIGLLITSGSGEIASYALGNWAPPFGIVLVLDRLSALMVTVVSVLATLAALYGVRGDDTLGPFFHTLFAFQVMGLNGAFLTGDLFNLFVFFEVMLIASYSLLLHGVGGMRVRAGMHYVLLNLIGSTLFLIGLGVLYGTAGTLNMAELSLRVASATADQQPLYAAGGMLLLVVFGLKAAMLPLYFWLPKAYASATASVAALFAVMTKVGVYAILRVFTLVFGVSAGALEGLVVPWLWPLAILTVVCGAFGVLGANNLKTMVAYSVVVSAGTLQAAVAMGTVSALRAGLFYLVHSTSVAAAFFLIADGLGRERGEADTHFVAARPLRHTMLYGAMFFVAAVAIAGMPPLSGFFGKVSLLFSAQTGWEQAALWIVLLTGGGFVMIALSRAGSTLLWRTTEEAPSEETLDGVRLAATLALLAASPAMVAFAAPIFDFTQATAIQLLNVDAYQQLVRVAGGLP